MCRGSAPPEMKARAWDLVIREGKSYAKAALAIRDEFDRDFPPAGSTIMLWVREVQGHIPYTELFDTEMNRRRIAERYQIMYEEAWDSYKNAGMTKEAWNSFNGLLNIQKAEAALYGANAATRIMVESAPPSVNPEILRAVQDVARQDGKANAMG